MNNDSIINREPKYNLDRWQIYLKTKLFRGLETTPINEVVKVPIEVKNFVDDFIILAIQKVLLHESYNNNNEGTQALELLTNQVIKKYSEGAIVRIELYPDPVGLCIVVNLKYDMAWLNKYKKYITYERRISDEDTIHRRIAG